MSCKQVAKSLSKLYKMIIQLTLLASVFVCYGDSYATNRKSPPIQEIENNRCFRDGNWYNNGEQMDSRGCCECWNGVMACGSCGGLDVSELEVSSYPCDNIYCEFGYNDDCSCKQNNRCFKDGNWYNNGEQMDSRGCCECWNGVMACGSCGGLDESELEISSYPCDNIYCEFGYTDDCSCKRSLVEFDLEVSSYPCDNKYCEFGYTDDCSCKGECEEEQNFGECKVIHITELFESPKMAERVFSYNPATRRCEPVLRYCSQTTANKFSSKRKCNKYCGGENKSCYKDGQWYNDGEQMDTIGLCECLDGIMACA